MTTVTWKPCRCEWLGEWDDSWGAQGWKEGERPQRKGGTELFRVVVGICTPGRGTWCTRCRSRSTNPERPPHCISLVSTTGRQADTSGGSGPSWHPASLLPRVSFDTSNPRLSLDYAQNHLHFFLLRRSQRGGGHDLSVKIFQANCISLNKDA
jgi:hypothetical protein